MAIKLQLNIKDKNYNITLLYKTINILIGREFLRYLKKNAVYIGEK